VPVISPIKARTLLKRADFLRVKASPLRVSTPSFSLQYVPEPTESAAAVGFTCAKRTFRTGVASNRGRRRLKAAWQNHQHLARAGVHYVLVGRVTILTLPFTQVLAELAEALQKAATTLDQMAQNGQKSGVLKD
jgi:ribonuclease P protein component